MDDDVDTQSAVESEIPLPRRGPRQRRIIAARDDLFGGDTDPEAEPPDHGDPAHEPTREEPDVVRRERSAALARKATARRRDTGPQPVVTPEPAQTSEREPEQGADPPTPGTGGPEGPDSPGSHDSPGSPDGQHGPGADRRPPATRRTRWSRPLVLAAVLIAFVVGLGAGLLLAPTGDASSAAAPLPSRPTLAGDVVGVGDGATVTVLVDGQSVDVAVLGLAPQAALDPAQPAPCGADTAATFARDNLLGQRVTLVPDPAGAEFDDAGRRLAYVVLGTQQNYTDLALLDGITRWDTSRAFTYGQVFAREEATARAASLGIWGAPCRTVR